MNSTNSNMPATIEEAMQYQASILIEAFSAEGSPVDGTKLDYSKESLQLIDQILKDFYVEEAPLPDDLHFICSCYVFETLRQAFGGHYLRSDEPNDFVLLVGEPDCQIICLVMERLWGSAQNWEKNLLSAYCDAVESQLNQKISGSLGAVPL